LKKVLPEDLDQKEMRGSVGTIFRDPPLQRPPWAGLQNNDKKSNTAAVKKPSLFKFINKKRGPEGLRVNVNRGFFQTKQRARGSSLLRGRRRKDASRQ